jgi:ribosome-associated translation inhibitor RaiA
LALNKENCMRIQVNTDRHITANSELVASVSSIVEHTLERFDGDITRIEVHLSDENGHKQDGNPDIRCLMEARLQGRQPLAVTHQAANVDQATDGAADKLNRLISSTLGRLRDQRTRPRGQPGGAGADDQAGELSED